MTIRFIFTPAGKGHRHASRSLRAAAALALFAGAHAAYAAKTPAGTIISNTASMTYTLPGSSPVTVVSNTVTFKVDELLDVAIARTNSADTQVTPGAAVGIVTFTVTNAGNGPEAMLLSANGNVGGADFNPSVTTIAIDTNGNGVYDPTVDLIVPAGGAAPVLQPDASETVFVISAIPAGAADGQRGKLRLTATDVTGSGAAGTVFAGQGNGGGDAVAGATTASQGADGFYAVALTSVAFVKSATVLDPFGGTSPVPGAVITYNLAVASTGSGTLPGVNVADAIPAGTVYRPGSLTLDAAALTDGADADAGTASSTGITVALGSVPAGVAHNIAFKVTIQ